MLILKSGLTLVSVKPMASYWVHWGKELTFSFFLWNRKITIYQMNIFQQMTSLLWTFLRNKILFISLCHSAILLTENHCFMLFVLNEIHILSLLLMLKLILHCLWKWLWHLNKPFLMHIIALLLNENLMSWKNVCSLITI